MSARPLVCVLLLVKPIKLLANGPAKLHRLVMLQGIRTLFIDIRPRTLWGRIKIENLNRKERMGQDE